MDPVKQNQSSVDTFNIKTSVDIYSRIGKHRNFSRRQQKIVSVKWNLDGSIRHELAPTNAYVKDSIQQKQSFHIIGFHIANVYLVVYSLEPATQIELMSLEYILVAIILTVKTALGLYIEQGIFQRGQLTWAKPQWKRIKPGVCMSVPGTSPFGQLFATPNARLYTVPMMLCCCQFKNRDQGKSRRPERPPSPTISSDLQPAPQTTPLLTAPQAPEHISSSQADVEYLSGYFFVVPSVF